MIMSKRKRFRGLKRVTPNPKPRIPNDPKPLIPYNPGIIMNYLNKGILDRFGRK